MQKFEDNLTANTSGALRLLAGASVAVTDNATGLPASLYSDNGVTPLPQPLTTDKLGSFAFYAADGKYTLTFSGRRFVTFTRQIILEDPADNPYATLAALNAATGSELVRHGEKPLNVVLNELANAGGVATVNGITPGEGNVALSTDNLPEDEEPTNLWFTAERVRAVALAGLSLVSGAAITAADTVLVALGKLQKQITSQTDAKDASNGYAGLTGFAINIKNAAGTVVSKLLSSGTVARTWTLPDKDGTVAMTSDIAGGSMTVLGSATVSTAVANISFLNSFSASYDKYVIELQGIRPLNAEILQLRLAVGGAAQVGGLYSALSTGTTATTSANQVSVSASNVNTSGGYTGTIEIKNARGTDHKNISVRAAHESSGGITTTAGEAMMLTSQVLSGFQLYWSAGSNFGAGTVRVYGIKNS
jgi:hypothetical protein